MAESDLIRGNVDTVILKVLYEGDRYGYDMIKQINARSGGQWEIKQPTLYACLKRLEKQGFVASYWDASESNGGRRKYYTLTESGKEVFVSYKNEWERSRDLFGELISDDEPILPTDDFSDVEDDEYDVPKRRPTRSSRAKKVKSDDDAQKTAVLANELAATTEETGKPQSVESIADEDGNTSDATADENASTDYKSAPIEAPHDSDGLFYSDEHADYREEYVYNDISDDAEPDGKAADKQTEIQSADANAKQVADRKDDDIGTRPTADPHAIIEEIYASTYTGTSSYSAARAKAYSDERTEHKTVDIALSKPAVPDRAAIQADDKSSKTALQPYADQLPQTRNEESLARREYKDILGDLIERCEQDEKTEEEAAAEQAASAATADGRIEIKRFDDVKQAVSELGNEVTVRAHNDSAKQYTHKYYYYSNRLMMTHYTAMCSIMFAIGLTLFLTFYVGLGMRMRYDYVLYVFAGLLPIAMFIISVIIFANNPDKKRRINVNFRFSLIIRAVIMLQAAVIVYCFNLIWGMPVGFSAAYIPSLVIPLVYSLFIPASEAIFMTLLRSGRYAVE